METEVEASTINFLGESWYGQTSEWHHERSYIIGKSLLGADISR